MDSTIIPILMALAGVLTMTAIHLNARRLDRQRIREYFASFGGQVQDISCAPFVKGRLEEAFIEMFRERDLRFYRVQYRDTAGNLREATVKTSFLFGIDFTQDIILQANDRFEATVKPEEAEEITRRLQREIERSGRKP